MTGHIKNITTVTMTSVISASLSWAKKKVLRDKMISPICRFWASPEIFISDYCFVSFPINLSSNSILLFFHLLVSCCTTRT